MLNGELRYMSFKSSSTIQNSTLSIKFSYEHSGLHKTGSGCKDRAF